MKPETVFQILIQHFGSQGWWPTTPAGKIHPVYHSAPRTKDLSEKEKFEICVGAILTQNTAWKNVEKALAEINTAGAMLPDKIAAMPFPKLSKMIHSSGYFRQKAKKLKYFSKYILKNYSGKVSVLLKRPSEELRKELLGLYGVGPETADSMMLYAGGRAVFVVDAYTRRAGNRIGLFETEDYETVRGFFEGSLRGSPEIFNEFHALFVALGKEFCRTRPLCENCPLSKICKTANG